MFFNKSKKAETTNPEEVVITEPVQETVNAETEQEVQESGNSYAFYKPDPYPKELVSVLKGMLQKLFPDAKRAYILEAQKSDQKGYLLIVDIDAKFLKMINIYLDGETKRVRGDIPIECVLYSKSGSLTEGIDPFYVKESAQSKANNLASKEFSSEVVFSQMPEFELWKESASKVQKDDISLPDLDDNKAQTETAADAQEDSSTPKTEPTATQGGQSAPSQELSKNRKPVIIPVKPKEKPEEKTNAKVKPSTKKELFGIINEYGANKSGEVSAVAIAAIKEYEFYIPYTLGKQEDNCNVDVTLPIDEKLRFKKVINPDDETMAVPLFTQKEDALLFAQKDKCKLVCLKYKDFVSSRAAELTGFDGVVINPGAESIFLNLSHPLLG